MVHIAIQKAFPFTLHIAWEFDGMVGMVSRGEAHLSTGGIYLDPRRGRTVDFTIPFFYDTLTLHVLRQEGNAVNFNVFLV